MRCRCQFDIVRRAYEHRTDIGSAFTRRYRLHRLVHFEWHDDIVGAIQREKNMKDWPRAWKARLVSRSNPEWRDLYDELV